MSNAALAGTASARPRLGFLGLGWIGRHRLQAIAADGRAEAAVIADPSPEMAREALALAPEAEQVSDLDDLLARDLDGIVIATPSALHAEQSIKALERGIAVFCQKPLGRDAGEVARVVEAARRADLLLGVDLSYRHTAGMRRIAELIRGGELGDVFNIDLVFHNAYGPDKPWFYDKQLSGGGCVIDLGVHLVDLALWVLDFPEVQEVSGHCRSGGRPLVEDGHAVEDFATATITLANGCIVRLACSWRLQAGCDAVIGASFYGTRGGAALRNVGGSFFDFEAELYRGTARERLVSPPDEWGARAAVDWARKLAEGQGFDAEAEQFTQVARVLDRIYGR